MRGTVKSISVLQVFHRQLFSYNVDRTFCPTFATEDFAEGFYQNL